MTVNAPLLEASSLSVAYGKVQALRNVDIHVDSGEIVSIIGPNGAGKTTFADTISGFLPYEGTVMYRGEEVETVEQSSLVENGMIYCTEKRDLFPFMTVAENLELGAFHNRDALEGSREFVYDLFPRLEERADQEARTMSGGEQQMLAIGRSLMGDPTLLVLDEPTIGLAPVIVEDISDALNAIVDQGVTVLLAEQNVSFALDHADRIYLLENGTVNKTGVAAEMKGDDYIRETYVGT
ncbi:ABC transporter ATP-binding protein [Natrialbaceae archaeon GCM10025810]|uniref:ABC transporter ATP-binding protein n=1 Tax=Halovalidus salilacus TaxID=3075124 RepID=UPI00360F5194